MNANPLEGKLSPHEREIADLVCQGLANREIGAILGISPNTVRNRTVQNFRKLDVENRAELNALLSLRIDILPGERAVMRSMGGFAEKRGGEGSAFKRSDARHSRSLPR